MPALYPIRAVAKLTGLTIETLRAWERRYQAVTPDRTARGRLYSETEVQRLMLLQTLVFGGHAIGQVAGLTDAELQNLAGTLPHPGAQRLKEPAPPAAKPNLQPLIDAIAEYDSDLINHELSKLALLLNAADLVHKVVLPLMRLAGEKWENGTFQIAQEHMFSACMRNLLGGLIRLQSPRIVAGRMLLTTPPGEMHEFGILAAAMLAVAQNFQVTYLGPNLPSGEILAAAEKCGANVVVLGIMKTNAVPALRREMKRFVSELPLPTELWAGGTGAAEVFEGVSRQVTFVLQDLPEFEHHLGRWKAGVSPGGV